MVQGNTEAIDLPLWDASEYFWMNRGMFLTLTGVALVKVPEQAQFVMHNPIAVAKPVRSRSVEAQPIPISHPHSGQVLMTHP